MTVILYFLAAIFALKIPAARTYGRRNLWISLTFASLYLCTGDALWRLG